MTDTAECVHPTVPACPRPGCGQPQKTDRLGRPMGWCPDDWYAAYAAKRNPAPIGAVRPGPRGVGFKVKTETGWRPSTADGRVLARPHRRESEWTRTADPEHLTEPQREVLLALYAKGQAGATDHAISERTSGAASSAGKRRLELQNAGLVEATGQRSHVSKRSSAQVWRITPAGAELASRLNQEHEK